MTPIEQARQAIKNAINDFKLVNELIQFYNSKAFECGINAHHEFTLTPRELDQALTALQGDGKDAPFRIEDFPEWVRGAKGDDTMWWNGRNALWFDSDLVVIRCRERWIIEELYRFPQSITAAFFRDLCGALGINKTKT